MSNKSDVYKKDKWILSAKEVTKYNPNRRNENGVYLDNDWTDFSDIGKDVGNGGIKLTLREYKKVEDRYVAAVKFLFEYYKCNRIQLISKKIYHDENLHRLRDEKLKTYFPLLLNKRTINIGDLDYVVRLILRGSLYAELFAKQDRRISVRFSYDFYMYFIFPENKEIIRNIENKIGLFVR